VAMLTVQEWPHCCHRCLCTPCLCTQTCAHTLCAPTCTHPLQVAADPYLPVEDPWNLIGKTPVPLLPGDKLAPGWAVVVRSHQYLPA
jgi:hypothetical protein